MRRDGLGDFQTPPQLVEAILRVLHDRGVAPERVLEPTCGEGSFIRGLVDSPRPPREILGLEVQPHYVERARGIASPPGVQVEVRQGDFFQTDLRALRWTAKGKLLVLGNPPWVTNAALGALGSTNLPEKANFKNLKGLDALTGESNFDIAEYIWLKLMSELRESTPTIGLLCKTSVARNVLRFSHERRLAIERASMFRINAKRWFNAATDACFFLVEMGPNGGRYEVDIHDELRETADPDRMGFVAGRLVADVGRYEEVRFLEASTPQMEWRQGLKHDAASVMELSLDDGRWVNQSGREADIEDDYLFPLLKAGDLRHPRNDRPRRAVIVPQRTLRESMADLPLRAPRTWGYLESHREVFDRRKSSIYRGKERFAIFGVGEYSFAPYKVIVSGLHKQPRFAVVGPEAGKPVMCDDTCYMLPFHSAVDAARVGTALNHRFAQEFLQSVVFWDAKRPITKALLKRVDLRALMTTIPKEELAAQSQAALDELDVAEPAGVEGGPQMSLDIQG